MKDFIKSLIKILRTYGISDKDIIDILLHIL